MTLSILTLNLWHDSPPWRERMELARRWIEDLAPDVVAFQEVLRGEAECQARDLVGNLGYAVAFGPVVRFWKRSDLWYGNAVASRWPIVEENVLELPNGDSRQRRGAISVRIETPWGPLPVVATHLNHCSAEVRAIQADALLAHLDGLDRSDTLPPLLLGDLNAKPDSPELAGLRGRLRDSFAETGEGAGHTWSERNSQARVACPPGERIDYVLVDAPAGTGVAGEPLACRVVCDEPTDGLFPSDHFGVYARLRAAAEPR
ncbi:MAG: endonuclease/exonuclease/phosphatase family protein [Myxococcota bacterium]|nr:endonuclease/exonuclease/phosphatase family protein [Myxococcota bacterium]